MTDQNSIYDYLRQVVGQYPRVQSIWLIGSRANDTCREESKWDLLAFADKDTFEQMKQDASLKRGDVILLVVYDSNNFEEPWPDVEGGRPIRSRCGLLNGPRPQGWGWREVSDIEAVYEGTRLSAEGVQERTYQKAVRIWPVQVAV
jgi:hypothetical protein